MTRVESERVENKKADEDEHAASDRQAKIHSIAPAEENGGKPKQKASDAEIDAPLRRRLRRRLKFRRDDTRPVIRLVYHA